LLLDGTETNQRLTEGTLVLVLSRKIGDEIIIDGRIRVRIIGVKGDRVRVGIEAPPEVSVDRQEVHRRRMEFTEPQPDAVI